MAHYNQKQAKTEKLMGYMLSNPFVNGQLQNLEKLIASGKANSQHNVFPMFVETNEMVADDKFPNQKKKKVMQFNSRQ